MTTTSVPHFQRISLKSAHNFLGYFPPTDRQIKTGCYMSSLAELMMANSCFERLCAHVWWSLSHLELLGVRSGVRLGSSRARLLFLPFLFLLLPFSPQIPSWTPARTRTNRQSITVDGLVPSSAPDPRSPSGAANLSYHSNG